MEENRARRIVERLRGRNVFAHLKLPHAGLTRYGIRVVLPDGREAIWDNDGTAGLEAQVMRDGILVGFVPSIPGSERFSEDEIIATIAAADYDRPIGRSTPVAGRRPTPPPPPPSLSSRFRATFGG
ncbi:hypothetical protein [Actinoplanes regularis]|uniref:hypothetical protein n=1 Tax=Actinoplanes regularis TaxID=52697 RepID=UPI0024A16701|nr:hypothetical protein [Actinoplanes regularis]GLW32563.1 hypothetical protein Areg01_55010 [Actinoplanes regularis]